MKKIININFHGRVVPIEETAYEILKQYIDSLRKYFANEEGRDEIINDIENRFAELFSERLKKESNCITDADVNSIIASMGRPEDFEAAVVAKIRKPILILFLPPEGGYTAMQMTKYLGASVAGWQIIWAWTPLSFVLFSCFFLAR
jgi:hypothetical protein